MATPSVNGYSVDIQVIDDALVEMGKNRTEMYNAILEMRDTTVGLNDVWEGDDKEAFVSSFMTTLQRMYSEEKRLNSLAWQLNNYVNELKENEAVILNDASNVD
jgi:hypothetical protein